MHGRSRIGLRVSQFRKRRGLTQAQLAELTERSVDAISSLERGKNIPSLQTVRRLAHVLNVPVQELLDESDDRVSPKRVRMLAILADAARSLSDADLELAVEQVTALSRIRKRR